MSLQTSTPSGATQAPAVATNSLREFLAFKLGADLERVDYDSFTVVIVLNIGSRVVGTVVDGVSDVITLTPEPSRPVPEFNSTIESDHLLAISAIDEHRPILVDIEKPVSGTEMGLDEQTLQ